MKLARVESYHRSMVIPSRTDDQRSLIEKPGLFCLPFLRVTVVAA